MRTAKTVGDLRTEYVYDGALLLCETQTDADGNVVYTISFTYDEAGRPFSATFEGETYYYVYDLYGNINLIYNSAGERVIRHFYSDSWGIRIDTRTTGAASRAFFLVNPYMYKGYYYDADLDMFYCGSRYYDGYTCRWINADGYVSTGQGILGNNMYAYCGNNPVMRMDPTGDFWIAALIVTAVVVCTSFLGCSVFPTSNVGAAKPYVDMSGSNDEAAPNCYSYAIGSPVNEQPGETSGRIPTNWNDVNDVGKSVEADLKAKGYTVRKISGPNAKVYNNEFKIALRVGTQPYAYNKYTGKLCYDYHFMRQTDTGQWAEKHGYAGDSVLWLPEMTPDTIPWTLYGKPYYDSKIIYYAVGN